MSLHEPIVRVSLPRHKNFHERQVYHCYVPALLPSSRGSQQERMCRCGFLKDYEVELPQEKGRRVCHGLRMIAEHVILAHF